MIPGKNIKLKDVQMDSYGSKIYKMNIDRASIGGFSEGNESVRQMVYSILNTERYEYLAYSWDFGIFLMDLYGKPFDYVAAELERRIPEALLQDDRIKLVDEFKFTVVDRNKVVCTFKVHTIFGSFDTEKVVNI